MSKVEDVLDFWFGDVRADEPVPQESFRLWFGGEEETDRLIRKRFNRDVARAARGDFDYWRQSARGTLALIILLDQFPRNIYRDTSQAYAFDGPGLEVCLGGLDLQQHFSLGVVERAFFYLPLEHSEDRGLQARSVRLFKELFESAPAGMRKMCEGFLDYALRHQEIIERFGRFPHRNAALGRLSTAEEEAFLKEPGSSF